MKSWTIGQKIAGGFVLPIFILIVLGVVAFESTQRLMKTSHLVSRSNEILITITDLLSELQDVESGQRGYILTGRDDYLEPYTDGVAAWKKSVAKLRQLTEENARHQRRLEALQSVANEREVYTESTIKTRKVDGLEAATQVLVAGRGKKFMDEIRRLTTEMSEEEEELLRQRAMESDKSAAQLFRILVGGTLMAILLVAIVALFIVRGIGQSIGVVVQSMRSASAELEAASTQQLRGAQEQAASTTEVSTTIRELVTTSRQIAENAQRVTQVAGDMSNAARHGDQTVHSAQEAIDVVRRQVDQIVGHMLSLGKKSQDIGGILEIITELADQTNILAINATIEAIGAGEVGKRFGVVAGEIRKLADRVGSATKDIRRLIEEIRTSANTTLMATEDGAKSVEAGARRFADVTESFRRIVDHVSVTTQAAREIEMSTKQQSSAMEQVGGAMVDVTQAARETEASSVQVQKTATDLAGLSTELTQLIQQQQAA